MPKPIVDSSRFELRIPPELKARLAAEAARRRQSLSAFILSAAEAQLEEPAPRRARRPR